MRKIKAFSSYKKLFIAILNSSI